MGKILMKAVQQQVFNLNKSGEKSMAYVLRPTRYSTIDEKQIVEYCAQNSMVPKAYISGAMVALAQAFSNFLLNGHACVWPGIGVFSLTSTGYAEGDVDKAGLDQLKKLNVRFLPCKELKTLVESVDVELDGVFDIAGETILVEATEDSAAKTQKFYKRVNRTVTVDAEGNIISGGTQKYSVTVTSGNSTMGSVSGGATNVQKGTVVTITATPNSGYKFTQWSDGVTQNPRSLVVSSNMSLTAQFASTGGSGGGFGA